MHRLRVVYVEADFNTRVQTGEHLKQWFSEVLLLDNGKAALTAIIEQRPDILVTGLNTKELNGIELLDAVREFDTELPIVVFTKTLKNPLLLEREALLSAIIAQSHLAEFSETMNSLGQLLAHQEEAQLLKPAKLSPKLRVVGIGASAGGLEAITELLANLHNDSGCAFIIAQHLSPSYPSMLVSILSKNSIIPVKTAEHLETLLPNTLYITPANCNIEIDAQDRIVLSDLDAQKKQLIRPSINRLFTSIAHHKKVQAIGVILSGTGSDGALGMEAIYEAGGITIVQDPKTAAYDGMPNAAIKRVPIDIITDVSSIGWELMALKHQLGREVLGKYQTDAYQNTLQVLYSHMQENAHLDLMNYKFSTIRRRIEQRIETLELSSLMAYLKRLKQDPEETAYLKDSILIGVTDFFRDDAAFQSLRSQLIKVFSGWDKSQSYRVWVVGCSSGEEVYTTLILLHEIQREMAIEIPLSIFATDIRKQAIEQSRKGRYSTKQLESLAPEWLERYFTQDEQQWVIRDEYRKEVSFSVNDLLQSVPYRQIDLILCRNLLIYFNSNAQTFSLKKLHSALNNNGLLMLGVSESNLDNEFLFETLSRKHKLFKKLPSIRKSHDLVSIAHHQPLKTEVSAHHTRNKSVEITEHIKNHASAILLPNIVVYDEHMNIFYRKGEFDFLSFPEGYVSLNLYQVLHESMSVEVRVAVKQAMDWGKMTTTPFMVHHTLTQTQLIKAYVVPVIDPNSPMFLLYFLILDSQELPKFLMPASPDLEQADEQIREELRRTKEHMQVLVEELQATNEELQSTNEELHATNDELMTSNDRLKSLNEELQSAYDELNRSYDENRKMNDRLSESNIRFQNVLSSLREAVVVSSLDGQLVEANPMMQALTGMSRTKLLLSVWHDLLSSESLSDYQALVSQVLSLSKSESAFAQTNLWLKSPAGNKFIEVAAYLVKSLESEPQIWMFIQDKTEFHGIQQQLQTQALMYRQTFEKANIGIAHLDLDGKFLRVNEFFIKLLGYEFSELNQTFFSKITHPEDLQEDLRLNQALLDGEISNFSFEKRFLKKSGDYLWVKLHASMIPANDKIPAMVIKVIEDISDTKAAVEKTKQAQSIIDSTQEGVLITDKDFQITGLNTAFEKMSGYSKHDLIGQHVSKMFSDKHPEQFYETLLENVQTYGLWSGEVLNTHQSGALYPVYLSVNALRDESGEIESFVGLHTDISKLKETQERIYYMANHDGMTGLPNRSHLIERMDLAIAKAERTHKSIAVFFLDLNRFKVINDAKGHDVGDEVLIEVASRLKVQVRKEDLVARHGGDEFVVLVENITSPHQASQIATGLLDKLRKPLRYKDEELQIGAAIGISMYPEDAKTSEELLRLADLAMYDAKKTKDDTFRFASFDLASNALERMSLENSIREGIKLGQFEVYYQPFASSDNPDNIDHFEALLRWNHPQLGVVSPVKFIPVAEETHQISKLTSFVLHETCKTLHELHSEFSRHFRISVNFAKQDLLNNDLFSELQGLLHHYHLNSEQVIIELTENEILLHEEKIRKQLEKYEKYGYGLAIDDFGTGYSNMAYLESLNVDFLKIDKSFIDRIPHNAKTNKLIKAFVSIAKALELNTIAEGVEHPEQQAFLVDNHFDYIQGYIFAKPMPEKRLKAFLRDHRIH